MPYSSVELIYHSSVYVQSEARVERMRMVCGVVWLVEGFVFVSFCCLCFYLVVLVVLELLTLVQF